MTESSVDGQPDIAAMTAQMVRGDETAYRVFYARYQPRLLRYLLVVTRDETAARDALQPTLLRVVRHIRRFDDETVFWSWLTVLARSAAADERRREHRHLAFLSRFFAQVPHANDASAPVDADQRLTALLQDELAALPPDERTLIEQKYLSGQSLRTLAAHHPDTSEKALESRLVRIRRKLKAAVLNRLRHDARA